MRTASDSTTGTAAGMCSVPRHKPRSFPHLPRPQRSRRAGSKITQPYGDNGEFQEGNPLYVPQEEDIRAEGVGCL